MLVNVLRSLPPSILRLLSVAVVNSVALLGAQKIKFFFNKDKYILASYTAINTYHVHIFYNIYPSLSGPTENYETTQFGAINRSWDIYFGEVIIQLILMCGGGGVVIHLQMNNFAIKKHQE